jgi:hypothetical protein
VGNGHITDSSHPGRSVDNADQGIDHGDQELPLVLQEPPGILQYLAPFDRSIWFKQASMTTGVEMVILERQPRSITHHIRPRPWPNIHSDSRAM